MDNYNTNLLNMIKKSNKGRRRKVISLSVREVRIARFWIDTCLKYTLPTDHSFPCRNQEADVRYFLNLPQFFSSSQLLQFRLLLQSRKFGMWVPLLQANEAKIIFVRWDFPKRKLNIYNIGLKGEFDTQPTCKWLFQDQSVRLALWLLGEWRMKSNINGTILSSMQKLILKHTAYRFLQHLVGFRAAKRSQG